MMQPAIHPAQDVFTKHFERGLPQLVWASCPSDLDTPVSAMLRLMDDKSPCFLLESVEKGEIRGRYSVIGLMPDLMWRCQNGKAEILRGSTWTPCSEPPLDSLRTLYEESHIDIPD